MKNPKLKHLFFLNLTLNSDNFGSENKKIEESENNSTYYEEIIREIEKRIKKIEDFQNDWYYQSDFEIKRRKEELEYTEERREIIIEIENLKKRQIEKIKDRIENLKETDKNLIFNFTPNHLMRIRTKKERINPLLEIKIIEIKNKIEKVVDIVLGNLIRNERIEITNITNEDLISITSQNFRTFLFKKEDLIDNIKTIVIERKIRKKIEQIEWEIEKRIENEIREIEKEIEKEETQKTQKTKILEKQMKENPISTLNSDNFGAENHQKIIKPSSEQTRIEKTKIIEIEEVKEEKTERKNKKKKKQK